MDGMRMRICVPTDGQEPFYNGYAGYHNIAALGIVAPDGMMVAMTDGDPGHFNDPGLVIENDVNFRLFMAGAPAAQYLPANALCDAAFGRTACIAPLPKENTHAYTLFAPSQLAALSATRVIVEWAFGEIRQTFPFIELLLRNKVFHTRPLRALRSAAILRNALRALRGTEASMYSLMAPPTLDEWLA